MKCRPMNSKEVSNGCTDVMKISQDENSVGVVVLKNDDSDF